jgi:NDP-4-keto-2,6-dideoxyhexose 3-C-methyltransferase
MISNCRSCGSKKLIDFLSLGNQYLSDFYESDDKPPKYPLNLVLCLNCSLVQLNCTAPSNLLYTERYGYRSGINQTMRSHLAGISEKACELSLLKQGDIVLDIGCNDGTLLKAYGAKGIRRIGFDAVAKFADDYKGTDISFINEYFNKLTYATRMGDQKAKIITAISMFYDLEEPNIFIADLADILNQNGIVIVQQNYLVTMLLNNAFDNIVHEHLEYFSLLSIETLLARHKLEVFDVELNDLNGGSFRTYICHKGARKVEDSVLRLRESERKHGLLNKEIYIAFASRIENIKNRLHGLIVEEAKKGKTIYAYGASTRGNTLLQYCDLGNTLINKAVERNSEKWGKKIASLGIPIISEEQARQDRPDYMLVLPWHFKDEFVFREADYLKGGGKFIFPLPDIEIIDNNFLLKK